MDSCCSLLVKGGSIEARCHAVDCGGAADCPMHSLSGMNKCNRGMVPGNICFAYLRFCMFVSVLEAQQQWGQSAAQSE